MSARRFPLDMPSFMPEEWEGSFREMATNDSKERLLPVVFQGRG